MRIIATIGPTSSNKKVLQGMVEEGITTIRLNFAHFYKDEFKNIIRLIRDIDKNIEIMGDLSGKKIRVYESLKSTYKIFTGEEVFFCGDDVYDILLVDKQFKMKLIPLSIHSKIIENNNITEISMKDGTMKFEILDKNKVMIKAKAINDGIVRAGKGCNIPNIHREDIILSNKDKIDIKWAVDNDLDIICQSYIESKNEIEEVKKYCKNIGGDINKIKFFSKVETKTGIDNYKEILENSDGIVIGRGDLVPECGVATAVDIQYKLLKTLLQEEHKKELIIATHLLDTLKFGYGPTMPEVESIYSFIENGVTGFLLASETCVGKYPINTVNILKTLIKTYK